MIPIKKKESKKSINETVALVEKAIERSCFSHMMTKEIDQVIQKKLGIAVSKYTIVLACGAGFAMRALEINPLNGLLFPCSFVVYEEKGKVWIAHVSIMRMSPMIGFTEEEEMADLIQDTGTAVSEIWDQL